MFHTQLENQLKTCSLKIKVSLPKSIRNKFPYPLIAKGYHSNDNNYWIEMQMYKSQEDNPIKRYHWKKDTDVMKAIIYLTNKFIEEYSIQ